MTLVKALLSLGLVCAIAGVASAQEQPPGVVARGSSDVLSGGLPVARQGDSTTSPGGVVTEGSSDVLINGKPAARLGDRTDCGVVVRGSSSVAHGAHRGQHVRLLSKAADRREAPPEGWRQLPLPSSSIRALTCTTSEKRAARSR
jgi:uncharacterized Zn-binding protein involved in type VI secretion